MDESAGLFVAGYHGHTTVHPLGLAIVLAMGVAMLFVPRRYAVWPMIVVACAVAPAQRIVVFTLDFNLLRVMVLFGWLRAFVRGEFTGLTWKPLDSLMVAWTGVNICMATLNTLSPNVFVNKLGYGFDSVGMYFLFRWLVRDLADLKYVVAGFAGCAIPVLLAFAVEKSTGRNLFAFLGGVPELTLIRGGRLRCQGAFAHPILAGCFWACVMPLVAAMWWNGWRGVVVVVVLGTMGLIVALSSSSTPVMAVIFGGVGAIFFFMRFSMRMVRWGLLALLVFLHMIMIAPVWHLIARIDVVSGSTGWHRFNLIDQAIRHAHEWWLTGSIVGTAHWGWGCDDVTNLYIVQGLHGGLPQLVLFIMVISVAFAGIGRGWRAAGTRRGIVILYWALGTSLFVHVMNFWAVSYFGQIDLVWYLTLATIGSVAPVSWVRIARNHRLGPTASARASSRVAASIATC